MKRLALLGLVLVSLMPTSQADASDIVISQFRFRGPAGAADEFVEVRNPGETPVSLAGWKLQACPATGGAPTDRLVFPAGTTIPPRRHVLVGGPGYAGTPVADFAYASAIADGGGVRLLDEGGVQIGAVGAPTANAACREGAGIAGMPTSGANTAYQRASNTNDNAADFVGPQAANAHNLATSAAPTITLAPPGGASEGVALALHAVAADADGDPLTFSWSTSLGSITFIGPDASLVVSDGPASVVVIATASDGALATSASETISVANLPPVIHEFPDATGPWGVPLVFSPIVTDADLVTLSYDAGPAFSVGQHIVTLTATDEDGASTTRTANVNAHARLATLSWAGPTSGGIRSLQILVQRDDATDPATSTLHDVPLILAVDGVDHAPLTVGIHAVSARLAPNPEYEADPIGATFDALPEAPLAPQVNAAPGAAPGQIDLSWSPPDDGGSPITSYHVYREGVWIAQRALPDFTDQDLEAGATYTYTVLAENGEGSSPPSAPATSIAQTGGGALLPTPELPPIFLAAVGGMFMVLRGLGRAWRGP